MEKKQKQSRDAHGRFTSQKSEARKLIIDMVDKHIIDVKNQTDEKLKFMEANYKRLLDEKNLRIMALNEKVHECESKAKHDHLIMEERVDALLDQVANLERCIFILENIAGWYDDKLSWWKKLIYRKFLLEMNRKYKEAVLECKKCEEFVATTFV